MTIRRLWLVRHGESLGNVAATRAEGSGAEAIALDVRDADVALSAAGEEQARALGGWLADHTPDRVWLSPYLRARQTLALAAQAAASDLHATSDERLRDRELGILDLLTRRGVETRFPDEAARRRRLGKYFHRPPGGESWADVALRLRSFLRDALDRSADAAHESALIVAHDAVVLLTLAVLMEWDETELDAFAEGSPVLNASVTTVVRGADGWRLESFSDVDHLRREDVPVTAHPGSRDVAPG